MGLLGGQTVSVDGREVTDLNSTVGRSLLVYLVTRRDRSLTRELICGTFWPDLPTNVARRRLSQWLWRIQQGLGGDRGNIFLAKGDHLSLSPSLDVWVDSEAFEERASTGMDPERSPLERLDALREAAGLYQGDFLSGFYDNWVIDEQDALREVFRAVLEMLIEETKSRAEFEESLGYARRLAIITPLRETAHREIMRLEFLLGRSPEALKQYELCRSILAQELGEEPDRETQDLYVEIAADRDEDLQSSVGRGNLPLFDVERETPFVGRDSERSKLVERLEATLRGQGGVVLIEGEPGVGKSRLLLEVSDDARWRGINVLAGRCGGPAEPGPYSALVQAIASGITPLRIRQLEQQLDPLWLSLTSRLVPELGDQLGNLTPVPQLEPAEESVRMLEAIARTFQALSVTAPQLLVLEDLHWADSDTLLALQRLAEELESSRLLLAISYRHTSSRERSDVWDALRRLDRLGVTSRISLAPHSPAQTEELARRTLRVGEVRAEFAGWLHRETAGNPLMVIETLRAMYEADSIDLVGGGTVPPITLPHTDLPIPAGVHRLVTERISALSAPVRSTLELAAVHGDNLQIAVLLSASDLPDKAVLDSVDALLGRRLLVEDPSGLRLSHDQLRRVVTERMSQKRREAAHGLMFTALTEHQPDGVEALAGHATEAGLWRPAFHYRVLAGHRAAALFAAETARRHYARAVDLSDAESPTREEHLALLFAYESVLETLGRGSEQAELLERLSALVESGSVEATELDLRRTRHLTFSDRFDDAIEFANSRLEAHRDDPELRVRFLVAIGTALDWSGRPMEAIPRLKDAVGLVDVGAALEADARYALGSALKDIQDYGAATAELRKARAGYEQLDDRRGRARVEGVLATIDHEQARTAEAVAGYQRSIELSAAIGYRHGEGVGLVNLATKRGALARIIEALQLFDRAMSIFRSIGNGRGVAFAQVNSAELRHLLLGDDDRAAVDASAALDYYKQIGDPKGIAQCEDVLAGITERRGDAPSARRQRLSALEALQRDRSGPAYILPQLLFRQALAELRGGNVNSATEYLEAAAHQCEAL